MTKLNYVNRKSDGVKLGQIVAKDLRKRAKQASPSTHKDISPIELYLDNKALTDDGLQEVARGLEDACEHAQQAGRATLSILHLSGNSLTCRSLFELARCMRLARYQLLELDLSNNDISVATDEDATYLNTFLASLGHCQALRLLNLSGNNLSGSRTWEVFAREYALQFRNNEQLLEHLADDIDDIGSGSINVLGSLDALTLGPGDVDQTLHSQSKAQSLHGLPSIGGINVTGSSLIDASALWLSFCVGRQKWIQTRLRARQGPNDSVSGANGFIWSSNDKLSPVGNKLLKQAEMAMYDPFRTYPPAPENTPLGRSNSAETGGTRRVSGTAQHIVQPSSPPRRRFSSTFDYHADDRGIALTEEMESTRRKIQRTIIDNNGPLIVELWRTSLKMLTFVRRVLPPWEAVPSTPALSDRSSLATSPESHRDKAMRTPSPTEHRRQSYASKLVVDTAEMVGPAISIIGASDRPLTPQIFRRPRPRHENFSVHSNSSSPQSTVNGKARAGVLKAAIDMTTASDEQIGPLPLRAWAIILRSLCDPNDVLTDGQVEAIISWGRDRRTLAMEADTLGKPESVQIWKVIDGMRCLSYED